MAPVFRPPGWPRPDDGALVALPVALITLSTLLAWTGDFAAAAPLIEEAEEINEATRSQLHFQPYAALQIAAWQGDEAAATALIEDSVPRARRRGEGLALACIDWATAVLYNGLGRYEKALAAAERASEHPQELWSTFILPELIEAAVRSGQTARAAAALDLLAATTRAASTDWALGTQARSRALLTRDEAAEDLYREAIDRLGRSGLRVELARADLLYGEWPRRSSASAMPAISFAPPIGSSSPPAPGRSPSEPGPSCSRPASAPPNAPRRRARP